MQISGKICYHMKTKLLKPFDVIRSCGLKGLDLSPGLLTNSASQTLNPGYAATKYEYQ